jgi:hypothetical protein
MSEWALPESVLERAVDMTEVMRTSSHTQWRELREHLQGLGLSPDDAVLADWVTEGDVNMGAIIATRDGRVFDAMVVMGYDRDHQRVANDEGFVSWFREIPDEKITPPGGQRTSWLQAVKIAEVVLKQEASDQRE